MKHERKKHEKQIKIRVALHTTSDYFILCSACSMMTYHKTAYIHNS